MHFDLDGGGRKKRRKHQRKRLKKDDAEEFEFKPNVNELLENVKPCSEKNADSDYSEEDADGADNENAFDQSDNYEEEENDEESSLSDNRELENGRKPSKKDEVKLEEDEVKMEVESESEGEEFGGSKMEPDSESDMDEELSNSFDSLVAAKINSMQEGVYEQEDVEKPSKRRKKRGSGENLSKGKTSGAPCEVCGKFFAHPSDMVKHMVTHTGARDYKCDICSESFPLLNILTRLEDS